MRILKSTFSGSPDIDYHLGSKMEADTSANMLMERSKEKGHFITLMAQNTKDLGQKMHAMVMENITM